MICKPLVAKYATHNRGTIDCSFRSSYLKMHLKNYCQIEKFKNQIQIGFNRRFFGHMQSQISHDLSKVPKGAFRVVPLIR